MKVLIQRVSKASVTVEGQLVSEIHQGLLLLVGIEKHDTPEHLQKMALKVLSYRLFPDEAGKMNRSITDIRGELLSVSQFTLAASTNKGLRPSFSSAAPPDQAKTLYQSFVSFLQNSEIAVKDGIFAADMQVSLVNDGPVTFLLEV